MQNLFGFNYQVIPQYNRDKERTISRFSTVYGKGGQIVHNKKAGYKVIPTRNVSDLAYAFKSKGYDTTVFSHRNGERIGVNVLLEGKRETKVGEMSYNAIITIPNNGNGMGDLSVWRLRKICGNGQMSKDRVFSKTSLKIPHNLTYKQALKLVKKAVIKFKELIRTLEEFDIKLD